MACGMRGTLWSRPSFLAAIMSIMPCAMALVAPRSVSCDLRASKKLFVNRFSCSKENLGSIVKNDLQQGLVNLYTIAVLNET